MPDALVASACRSDAVATEDITIECTADDNIRSGSPTATNAGATTSIIGYGTGPTILFRSALLRFPTTLLAGKSLANFVSAKFKYEVANAASAANQIFFEGIDPSASANPIAWGTGTPPSGSSISWNNKNQASGHGWAVAGGDYISTDGSAVEGALNTTTGVKEWTVSSAVQALWTALGLSADWVYGIYQAVATASVSMQIASLDDATGKVKPQLIITLNVPESSSPIIQRKPVIHLPFLFGRRVTR